MKEQTGLAKETTMVVNNTNILKIPYPISLVRSNYGKKTKQDWQDYWNKTDKGRYTYNILKAVDSRFACPSQIVLYFISSHGSFPKYLHKINKRSTSKCDCGSEGDAFHYLFGNCMLMPKHFKFNRNMTVRKNFINILFDNRNYNHLRQIYN